MMKGGARTANMQKSGEPSADWSMWKEHLIWRAPRKNPELIGYDRLDHGKMCLRL